RQPQPRRRCPARRRTPTHPDGEGLTALPERPLRALRRNARRSAAWGSRIGGPAAPIARRPGVAPRQIAASTAVRVPADRNSRTYASVMNACSSPQPDNVSPAPRPLDHVSAHASDRALRNVTAYVGGTPHDHADGRSSTGVVPGHLPPVLWS